MVNRLSLLCVGLAFIHLGSVAFADDEDPVAPEPNRDDSRFSEGAVEFGLRTGLALPLGRTGRAPGDTSNETLSSNIQAAIPLWVDVGYRLNSQFYVGLAFQYGFGFVPQGQCPGGASCSVSDLHFATNFMYHLSPDQPADLWVGLGVGYEWLELSASGFGVIAEESARGFEYANFQVGLDIATSSYFALGPFASCSLGRYDSVSIDDMDADLTGKSLHAWLVFGMRGTLEFAQERGAGQRPKPSAQE